MDFAQIAQYLKMPDEDKVAFLALTEKYPLATVVVPKSELEAAQKSFTDADAYVKKWEEFRTNNWDPDHGMTRKQWEAEQEVVALRGKVATMEAGGGYSPSGGDMNFADVEKELVTKGYVTKADLAGLPKKEDISTAVNQHGMNQEFFFSRSVNIPLKYMQEFGTPDFDMEAFMRFTLAPGNIERFMKDPVTGQPVKQFDTAYEEFVAGKRLEAQRAQLQKEREALNTEKQTFETKKTEAPSPTDTGTGASIPPFQRHIQNLDGDDPLAKIGGDAPFGSGVLSAQINEAIRKGDIKMGGKPN